MRDAGNRWVFRDLLDAEGLQPWGGVRAVLMSGSAAPTHYVDVADNLEPAVRSLEAHHLYNSNLPPDFPGPRDLVTFILRMGGRASGLEYAVALRQYAV